LIQIRVGDIILHGGEDGKAYFTKIKEQLDLLLSDFPVHYHFFAEDQPEGGEESNLLAAPKGFEFLNQVLCCLLAP